MCVRACVHVCRDGPCECENEKKGGATWKLNSEVSTIDKSWVDTVKRGLDIEHARQLKTTNLLY